MNDKYEKCRFPLATGLSTCGNRWFARFFILFPLLLPLAAAHAQVRTPWKINLDGPPVYFANGHLGLGDTNEYSDGNAPAIPASNAAGWSTAPDGININFSSNSLLPQLNGGLCPAQGTAGDFIFFQTFVYIPTNVIVTSFKLTFSRVDDGVQATVFNTANVSGGTAGNSSYLTSGSGGTIDLTSLILRGQTNRIVLTLVDDTCSPSATTALTNTSLLLNGNSISTTNPPRVINFCATIYDKQHTQGPYSGNGGTAVDEFRHYDDVPGDNGAGTPGMVSNYLDANGLPVYILTGGNSVSMGWVSNAYSFSKFFTNTGCGSLDLLLPMVETGSGSGVFQLVSNSCFLPIDGVMCGNEPNQPNCNAAQYCPGSHNYLFTTHISSQITFSQASDYFKFVGDDDVWVFINKRLVLDMGGLHSPLTGQINASTLVSSYGLTYNTPYQMDIFNCERSPCQSSLNMYTTFLLQPDVTPPHITAPPDIVVSNSPNVCGATNVNLGVVTNVGDNCTLLGVISNVPSLYTIGTNFVTWQAVDGAGNTTTVTQKVVVVDTQLATITCPGNIVVSNDPGACYATGVGLGTPVVNDNCGSTTYTNDAGRFGSGASAQYPVGTNLITWTVFDNTGNTNFCQQTVIVKDAEFPQLIVPTAKVLPANAGQCSVSNVNYSVTPIPDNCLNKPVVQIAGLPTGSTFPVGITTNRFVLTDINGNSTTNFFTVTVKDAQPPVLSCWTNMTVSTAPGQCASNVTFNPTATDNCGGSLAVTNVPASGSSFAFGTTTVKSFAIDASGNSNGCIFTVTVVDTQPPVITTPSNIVVSAAADQCGSNVTFNVTAVDNCGTVQSVLSTPDSGSLFPVGITTVTNVAVDNHGNSNQSAFTVTVVDNQPPAIHCPSGISVLAAPGQCASNVTFAVSATDNCGAVTVTSTPPSGFAFPLGITAVTNTATDSHGNSNQCTFNVTVLDKQVPVINCISDITVNAASGQCASNVTFNVTATDNCGATPPVISTPPSGSTFPIGTTIVTNTATDVSGNSTLCTFNVIVLDKDPPVMTCPSNITVVAALGQCSSNVTFNVGATEACGTIASQFSQPPSGFAFPVGTTIVTNTAVDDSGNTNHCSFSVTVIDGEPPTFIACPADISTTNSPGTNVALNISLGAPLPDDNCGVLSVASNAPAVYPFGTNIVTWTVVDIHGNSNTCPQLVIVNSNPPPAFDCPATITVFADNGLCTASNVALVTPAVTFVGCGNVVVSSNKPAAYIVGTNIVTWTATDQCGRFYSCQQQVIVIDNQFPTIDCPGNLVFTNDPGQCYKTNVTFVVTPHDNCSRDIEQTAGLPTGSTFPTGVTTNRFVATDDSGNSTTCTFTVTVLDKEAPTITCPDRVIVQANSGCFATNVFLDVPTYDDNCGVVFVTNSLQLAHLDPVSWWQAESNALESMHGAIGTIKLGTTFSPGEAGMCFDFDGTNGCVMNTNTPAFTNIQNTFTMEFWAKPRAGFTILPQGGGNGTTGQSYAVFPDWGGSGGPAGVGVCVGTNGIAVMEHAHTYLPSSLSYTNPINGWTHIAVVYSNAQPNLFVNGVFIKSGVTSPRTYVYPSKNLGSSYDSALGFQFRTYGPYNGLLDEYAVYDHALTPQQIQAIYAAAAGGKCATPTPPSICAPSGNFPIGTNFVTWTVMDASGNSNSCPQTVIVQDTQPPTITGLSDVIVSANTSCLASNVSLGFPITGDNCAVLYVTNNAPTTFGLGTNFVTWTVSDTSGNLSTYQQHVIVRDTSTPAISCPSNIVLSTSPGLCARTNVTYTSPGTSDNCGTPPPLRTAGLPSGGTFPKGVTTNIFVVSDSSGNSNTCSFTVTINDTEPPTIITCPAPVVVDANSGGGATNVFLGTPNTSDNCDVPSVSSNAPAFFPAGTNFVLWVATDTSGNSNSCVQTVIVRGLPPTITCPTNLTLLVPPGACSVSNVSLGAPTIGNSCGTFLLTNDAPAVFPLGTNIVNWTVTNTCGKSATCQQTVIVKDNQPPQIICPGNLVFSTNPGGCSHGNVTFIVTNADNCGGVVLIRQSGFNSGSSFPKGVTTNRYMALDNQGNSNTCSFTVTVNDNEPPAIQCPPDVTVHTKAGVTTVTNVVLGRAIVSDNCSATIAVTNNAPHAFPVGTNIVTWKATDDSGNTNTCQQRVIVIYTCGGDLSAPALEDQAACNGDSVLFDSHATSTDPITFTWRFQGQVIAGQNNSSLYLPTVQPSNSGLYTVEIATPCSGITNSANLNVVVAPTTTPTTYQSSSAIIIFTKGPSLPYPSILTPQCIPGVVRGVTLTLFNYTHTSPSDVNAIIVGPDGSIVKFMGGAGGYEAPSNSVTLNFSDATTNVLPQYDDLVSGMFHPNDYSPGVTLPFPAPGGTYFTNMASFNGINPNGPWSLYVYDAVSLDGGTIASWALNIDWGASTNILVLRNPIVVSNYFQAEVWTRGGSTNIILRSTNLASWQPVSTNVYTNIPGIFQDHQTPLGPLRFYRALQLP